MATKTKTKVKKIKIPKPKTYKQIIKQMLVGRKSKNAKVSNTKVSNNAINMIKSQVKKRKQAKASGII